MFWKKFYFVVILLSCNCFLLCSNGFCEGVKKFFGCGVQQGNEKKDNFVDNSHVVGLNNNKHEDYNNYINNNNNDLNNEEDDKGSKGKNSEDDNSISNISNDHKNYNIQDDKNVLDLSEFNIPKEKIISPFWCVFFSATACVGKTSILNSLQNKDFVVEYKATDGIVDSEVTCKKSNDVEMKIGLIDSSGDPKYRTNDNYFSFAARAKAIVFVYDITDWNSFNSLEEYISAVKTAMGEQVPEKCRFFLLGNKFDLVEETEDTRQVGTDDAIHLAADKDLIFLGECSAKENTYVPYEPYMQLLYCINKECLTEDGKCVLRVLEGC